MPLGPFNNQNGQGTSPILAGNLLVLVLDQDSGSYMIAVDKETGRVEVMRRFAAGSDTGLRNAGDFHPEGRPRGS